MDPATPTSFRLLLVGKPERKFEIETTLPYAAFRWLVGLGLAIIASTSLGWLVPALGDPPGDSPSITRPDDQGDEQGQGQGTGTDQGQGPGLGRGNDPAVATTPTTSEITTTSVAIPRTTTTTGVTTTTLGATTVDCPCLTTLPG